MEWAQNSSLSIGTIPPCNSRSRYSSCLMTSTGSQWDRECTQTYHVLLQSPRSVSPTLHIHNGTKDPPLTPSYVGRTHSHVGCILAAVPSLEKLMLDQCYWAPGTRQCNVKQPIYRHLFGTAVAKTSQQRNPVGSAQNASGTRRFLGVFLCLFA